MIRPPTIRLYLLNSLPRLLINGEPIELQKSDVRSFLIYTLYQRRPSYTRAKLAETLYRQGDDDTSDVNKRLRDVLWYVRKHKTGLGALFPEDKNHPNVILYKSTDVWVDANAFSERAQPFIDRGSWHDDIGLRARLRVLTLYRYGHFLSEFDFEGDQLQRWARQQRRELAHKRHTLFEQIIKCAIHHEAYGVAGRFAQRWYDSEAALNIQPCAVLQYLIWLAAKAGATSQFEMWIEQLARCERRDKPVYHTKKEWEHFYKQPHAIEKAFLPLYAREHAPLNEMLIERNELRDEIQRMLLEAQHPLCLGIVGVEGVGKTSLAAAVMSSIALWRSVIQITLDESSQEDSIISACLYQMQVVLTSEKLYDEKRALLKQILLTKQHVIVIDEGATRKLVDEPFVERLMELFKSAHLVLVAQWLPPVEIRQYHLNGLSAKGVHQLLQALIQQRSTETYSILFDQVAMVTGGLPLALRLVAGAISQGYFNLKTLVEQLAIESNGSAPKSTLYPTPIPLHLTKQRVQEIYRRILDFIWARGTMMLSERLVLYALSVFNVQAGASLEALKLILATVPLTDRLKIDEKLKSLTTLRWITPTPLDPTRYTLHPFVHQFVRDQRDDPKLMNQFQTIERACYRYVLEQCEATWLTYPHLERELHTIITALNGLICMNDLSPQVYKRAAAAVEQLVTILYQRAVYTLTDKLIDAVLHLDQTQLDSLIRAKLMAKMGERLFKRGDLDMAEEMLHQGLALGLAEHRDSFIVKALIWRDLGRIALQKTDYVQAKAYLENARALAEQLGEYVIYWQTLANLGAIARAMGDNETAKRMFIEIEMSLSEPAHKVESDHGLLIVLQYVLSGLGIIAQEAGDFEGAEKYYERTIHILSVLGNRERLAYVYLNLGVLARTQGQLERAFERYRLGRDIVYNLDQGELRVIFEWHMGVIYMMREDNELAGETLEGARAAADQPAFVRLLPGIYNSMGVLRMRSNKDGAPYFIYALKMEHIEGIYVVEALYGLILIWLDDHPKALQADKDDLVAQTLARYNLDEQIIPPFNEGDVERTQLDLPLIVGGVHKVRCEWVATALKLWVRLRAGASTVTSVE
jgi:tetratricopeptide (TPR) repeat protein